MFTVPAPDIIIIQPIGTHYVKTSIILMCNITLSDEVDARASVAVKWYRNGSVVSGTGRITPSAVSGSGHKFFSNLTFSPLDELDNNTNITCSARAIPQQHLQDFVLSGDENDTFFILTVKIKVQYKLIYSIKISCVHLLNYCTCSSICTFLSECITYFKYSYADLDSAN